MFFGTVEDWTSVLNTDIPFTTDISTNNSITNKNGVLSIARAGHYNYDAILSVSGVTSPVTFTVYADGEATDYSVTAFLSSTVTSAIVPILDAFKVIYARNPNVATISIRPSVAGATVSGSLRVEYVR